MRLTNEGLVGLPGPVSMDESEHRSTKRHSNSAVTGAVSAPLIPLQGWIRAANVGAQPN